MTNDSPLQLSLTTSLYLCEVFLKPVYVPDEAKHLSGMKERTYVITMYIPTP